MSRPPLLLPIVIAPDPVLERKAEAINEITDDIRQLLHDMLFTMYDAPGIGLAAPQVGKSLRVIVVDTRRHRHTDNTVEDDLDANATESGEPMEYEESEGLKDIDPGEAGPFLMINPEIIESSDNARAYDEGCLSFPEEYAEVVRPDTVRIRYLDELGTPQELFAEGLLATCIQHEIDHLDGINFVDHLSRLKRTTIMKRMKKRRERDELDLLPESSLSQPL